MADISEDDRSIVFTRPAPGFRFNPTRRQVEQVGPYVLAASRAKIDTFLESLPALSLAEIPEDNIECPICTESYQVPQNSDMPVRLPCSHIIGKDCLSKWLNSSVRNANNNGCPTCRAVLFDRYRPVDELHVPTVRDILESLRFDVLGYLRVQEHERTPAEYNRIRSALNGFRASMDGAASREARGLIRLLNSDNSTVQNQLASLRADVGRYARTRRHERTFEEFRRINHALTELVPSLDGATRGEFFNLVRDLHRAFQSARPVQMQRGHDVRTEPVNPNYPTVREPLAPGRAQESIRGQEVANPIRTAPDGPEEFDQNDRATVREVPERGTARASSGNEELADDSPRAGRARLRARVEDMSRIRTLQERDTSLERHHPQMVVPRPAQRVAETRADRPGAPGATDQRHAALIAEIANQRRVVAEHGERHNRAPAARRPRHVATPPGRGHYSVSMGTIGTSASTPEERRRAVAEQLDHANTAIYAIYGSLHAERSAAAAERLANRSSETFRAPTDLPEERRAAAAERLANRSSEIFRAPTDLPEERRAAAAERLANGSSEIFRTPADLPEERSAPAAERLAASRRNDDLRYTMPGRREARTNNLARPAGLDPISARADEPQTAPREQPPRAAAPQQRPSGGNREMRFTIPRLEPTFRPRGAPAPPPPAPSSRSATYASMNERITALDASLARMENQQRILARTLERLEREGVAARMGSGGAVTRGAGAGEE